MSIDLRVCKTQRYRVVFNPPRKIIKKENHDQQTPNPHPLPPTIQPPRPIHLIQPRNPLPSLPLPHPLTPPRHHHPPIIQNLLRHHASPRQTNRHPGPGMRTRPNHIQPLNTPRLPSDQIRQELEKPTEDTSAEVAVEDGTRTTGARRGPEGEDVEERVREAEDGAAVEVEFLSTPVRAWIVVRIVRRARAIMAGQSWEVEGWRPGWVAGEACLIGSCVAFAGRHVNKVTDRHEHHDAIGAFWRGARVDPAGDVDVETRLVRDKVTLEDTVEGLPVLVREKDVMCAEFRDREGEAPVEGDTTARRRTIGEGFRPVLHPLPLPHLHQSLHDPMEPSNRIPDPLRELRILQQTIRTRGIERRHAHIHTPEHGLERMQRQQMLQETPA
ncbi:hypothetical protein KC333_g103 [Hortaea werneckii]|nr:hypothetical protein KC333_g103 [Hortaea werneckii]